MKKRFLSLLLAATLAFSSVPVSAMAAETNNIYDATVTTKDGNTLMTTVVDSDYTTTITLDDSEFDASEVTVSATNAAGTTSTRTFATPFTASNKKLSSVITSLDDLKTINNGNISVSFNDEYSYYELDKAYTKDSTTTWVFKADENAETVHNSVKAILDKAEANTVIIKKGASITFGGEKLEFVNDVKLNNPTRAQLREAVNNNTTLEEQDECESYEMISYLPVGSTFKAGIVNGVLTEAIKTRVYGPHFGNQCMSKILKGETAADRKSAMISLVNAIVEEFVNDSNCLVEIKTASYMEEEKKQEEENNKFWAPINELEEKASIVYDLDIKDTMSEADFAAAKKQIEEIRAAYNALTKEQQESFADNYPIIMLRLEKAELGIKNIEVSKAAAAEKAQKDAEIATLKAAAAAQNEAAKKVLALTAKATAKVTVKTSGTKVKATWKAVEGAEKYAVIVVKNGKKQAPVMVTGTTYTVSAPGTKVAIIVAPVATFENVEYTGKEVTSKSVIVKPARPSVKVKKSGKKFKVTVKKASVTGYQIQTAKNSKFKKNLKKYTVKGTKVSKSYKLTTLKKGTNYVRVRAYKTISGKKYYSSWSKAVKVKR